MGGREEPTVTCDFDLLMSPLNGVPLPLSPALYRQFWQVFSGMEFRSISFFSLVSIPTLTSHGTQPEECRNGYWPCATVLTKYSNSLPLRPLPRKLLLPFPSF